MRSGTALVTGASGFIGKHLVDELRRNGYEVSPIVRKASGLEGEVICDLSNVKELPDILEGRQFDVFFHLAWSGASGDGRNDANMQNDSVNFSVDCAEVAKELGCKRFIFAGSIAELTVRDETSDIYGASKKLASERIRYVCKDSNMEYFHVLLPSTYGEGLTSGFMADSVNRMLRNEAVTIRRRSAIWDFAHVSDVVKGMRLVAEKGTPSKYYIGTGTPKTMEEFTSMLLKISNSASNVTFMDGTSSIGVEDLDIGPISTDIGYVPSIDFRTGAEGFVRYMRSILP